MAHYKKTTIFDNFNDNTIDTNKWFTLAGQLAETSGRLKLTCSELDETRIHGLPYCDMTKGILAAKLYFNGESTINMLRFFGFCDESDLSCVLVGDTNYPDLGFTSYDLSFDSGTVVQDETVIGISSSWVDGTYIGVTATGNTVGSTVYFKKSSDGITWTNIWHGTLDYLDMDLTHVGLRLGLYNSEWDISDQSLEIDDACYFAEVNSLVRVGDAFTTGIPKVRVGGSWVTPTAKLRVGGSWVTL